MIIIKITCLFLYAFVLSLSSYDLRDHNETGFLSRGVFVNDWIPMSQGESLDYYSAAEICYATNRDGCTKIPKLDQSGSKLDVFDVCLSYNSMLLRHKSTSKQRDSIATLVKLIYQQNNTAGAMIFVGDSISRAHFHNSVSSLTRFGFVVRKEHGMKRDSECAKIYVEGKLVLKILYYGVFFFNGWTKEQTFNIRNFTYMNLEEIKGPVQLIVNYGLHYYTSIAESEYRFTVKKFLFFFAKLSMINNYHLMFRETSAQHFPTSNGAYVIKSQRPMGDADNPLFVNTTSIYSSVNLIAANIFPLFSNVSTKAQHVMSSQTSPLLNFRCQPIMDEKMLYSQNWRNRIVYELLNSTSVNISCGRKFELRLSEIVDILPLFNYTAARFDAHLHHFKDSTHFCDSPLIWSPTWAHMYDLSVQRFLNPRKYRCQI